MMVRTCGLSTAPRKMGVLRGKGVTRWRRESSSTSFFIAKSTSDPVSPRPETCFSTSPCSANSSVTCEIGALEMFRSPRRTAGEMRAVAGLGCSGSRTTGWARGRSLSFCGTNGIVRQGPCLEGGRDGDLQFDPFLTGDLGLVARPPYWGGVWGRDGGASIARRSCGGAIA